MNSQKQLMLSGHSGWFLFWGIALVVLGFFAITFSVFTTLISVILLGAIIFAGGLVLIFDAFKFWWGRWGGFFFDLILGILYLFVGVMLFQNPISASISLTLLLGVFYTAIGIFRLIYSLLYRQYNWGWHFFNGIISLILGVLILESWPASSLFILGLFVGIDLLVCGWVYIMLSLSAHHSVKEVRHQQG